MAETGHTMLDAMLALPPGAVDASLAAAVPTADEPTQARLVAALLERGDPTGLRTVVRHYFELPEALQRRLVASVDRLYRPLREAVSEPAGRHAAITIIRRAGDANLAYLAADLLRDPDPRTRTQAGACLVELARQAATDPGGAASRVTDAAGVKRLIESVEQALARCPAELAGDAIAAAFWLLPRPMPGLRRTLEAPRDAAVTGMRAFLGEIEHEASARGVLWALSVPTLAEDATATLIQRIRARRLGPELARRALLRLPAAGRTLQRARRLAAEVGPELLRADRPAEHAAAVLSLLDRLPMDADTRASLLVRASQHGDAGVRAAAARRLAGLARQRASEDDHPAQRAIEMAKRRLEAMCDDDHEAVARLAATAWLEHQRRSSLPLRPLTRLVINPHASVRHLAARRLGPLGFDHLWRAWPRLEPERRLAAAEALIRLDPHFHRLLGDRLVAEARAHQRRALEMIAELGQGSTYENALLRLAKSHDHALAAAAVRALGGVDSDPARQAVSTALHSERAEVRAQAIAATELDRDHPRTDALLALAHDEAAAAPRAAAIHALLNHGVEPGRDALAHMLDDPRRDHRLAALKLVERLGLITLARHVGEVAVSDADDDVRNRAWSVVAALIRLMNEEAGQPSPDAAAAPTGIDPDADALDPAGSSDDRPDAVERDDPLTALRSVAA